MSRVPGLVGRLIWLSTTLVTAAVLLQTTTTAVAALDTAPAPPVATILPANYRALAVERVSHTGSAVSDAVVTSVGPPTGQYGLHSRDLQVASFDPIAHRWIVVFDAQKVSANAHPYTTVPRMSNLPAGATLGTKPSGSSTLLDPNADVTINKVLFAHLLPGPGRQLIFSAINDDVGSGSPPAILVVVDFQGGVANLAYAWFGTPLNSLRISRNRIMATASFWTNADSSCCPLRNYQFTVGPSRGRTLDEITDQRPWLGAYLKLIQQPQALAPWRVLGVVKGSPAAAVLHPGDIILSVPNAPRLHASNAGDEGLIDEIDSFDAGQTAHLVIERAGVRLSLHVRLGSLADNSAGLAFPPKGFFVAAV